MVLKQVWRVEWNITGTILASSGDDGTVRLWKGNYDLNTPFYLFYHYQQLSILLLLLFCFPANYQNEWKCLSAISGEDEEED